jgi:DNA-binding GntR family transcriptional regulator
MSSSAIQSITPPKTLVEQVYDNILDAICSGALAPGERITQDEIAARLQVSRQPVMTALGQLRAQGFLVERGRRGLQVAAVDRAHFDAIYEFRSVVEPLAASLAAQRMTPELLSRARGLVARGREVAAAGDAAATLQADIDFHSLIYEASGNPLIVQSMQAHWQHLRRSMSEVLKRPRFTQKVWREHAAIVDALGRGDSAAASQLIADHVNEAHRRVGGELGAPTRSA